MGESIRHWRKRAGLSLEDLGKAIGRSAATVSRIENGGNLRIEQLETIAKALGLPAVALLAYTGEQQTG